MRILLFVLLLLVPANTFAQVAEICENGIDDDGDTLIDCTDPDCFYEAPCQTCWGPSQSLSAPTLSENDLFGVDCQIYRDQAIIGLRGDAPLGSFTTGSAVIYSKDPNSGQWNFSQQIYSNSCTYPAMQYGAGVAIHEQTAAVGAPLDCTGVDSAASNGKVYIYEKDPVSGQWIETQVIISIPNPTSGAYSYFGSSLAISDRWLIVGLRQYRRIGCTSASGAVAIYKKSSESGIWELSQFFPNDGCGDSFGSSITLFGDTFVASAPGGDEERVVIYKWDPFSDSWAASGQVQDPNPSNTSNFGVSADLSGSRLIVGNSGHSGASANEGIAYIFEKDVFSAQWELAATINNPGTTVNSFGISVSISGNVAVVGDRLGEINAVAGGAVYAYQRDPLTGNWDQNQALLPAVISSGDYFGGSTILRGKHLIASAWAADSNGTDSGNVFAFEMEEGCYVGSCETDLNSIVCLPYTGSNSNEIVLTIENNTAFEVTSVFVPPVIPGSPGTISPNVIPLATPLQTGESTTLTLTLSNAVPNETIEFTVALMANDPTTGDLVECCSAQVNVAPPDCADCLLITNETFVSTGNDLEYTFTLENLPADSITLAEHVVLAPNTTGIALSNQWFNPTGGLLDGESATLTTMIENGAGLAEICIQFTIHDALLEECCGFVRCLAIPNPLIPTQPQFIRGDANGDSLFNIADTVKILEVLFQSQPVECSNAMDINDDDVANIADAIYGLGVLFSGFPPPVAPFPSCGADPTSGSLSCQESSACVNSETQGG